VPVDAVLKHAARILGKGAETKLVLHALSSVDLGLPAVGSLARALAGVFRELESLARPGLSEIACASFDEMLLGLLVATLMPPSTQPNDSGTMGTDLVRRAQDQLRERAAGPVRLVDLASELGVGLRTLQMAFSKDVGYSPRDFLMQCRLDLARARLQNAETGERISDIAFDSGFTDLGFFARRYRDAYGELPSETLKRR
jgi:AraC-like DNA-binding protein